MQLEDLKILLIQARPDAMKDHEFDMVLKFGGLKEEQFRRLDIFHDDASLSQLAGMDAVMIGGAGDYLLTRGDIPEEADKIKKLIVEARNRQLPIIGMCFGAQIITTALGGELYHDEDKAEVGTLEVTKTPESAQDPIFKELPKKFMANLGHKDHIKTAPPGAVRLAKSELMEYEAYTFPGEGIYALVFHPELDSQAMIDRINYYAEEYHLTPAIIKEMTAALRPTPEPMKILPLFFQKIVVEGQRYPGPAGRQAGKSE